MSALNATEYLQRQLSEQLEEAQKLANRLRRERAWRVFPAYGFKLLALIGAVSVAAGPPEDVAQGIGIAIAVVVILDTVFSNHLRLMSVAAGANAARQLVAHIEYEHRVGMPPVLELKETDPPQATRVLNDLNKRLLEYLGAKQKEIEDRLAEDDLRALQALSLDEQRQARSS